MRTSTGQRSFAFHGPSIWNSLLSTLRYSSLSLRAFTGAAKEASLRSWTITNSIRRCWAFCDRGAVYKCSDLLMLVVVVCTILVNTAKNAIYRLDFTLAVMGGGVILLSISRPL